MVLYYAKIKGGGYAMQEESKAYSFEKLEGNPGKRKNLNTKEPIPARECLTVRNGYYLRLRKSGNV